MAFLSWRVCRGGRRAAPAEGRGRVALDTRALVNEGSANRGGSSLVDEAGARAFTAIRPADETTSLWIIAGLAMAPAAALGIGRFAYALLLPAMVSDLGWHYADAGAMNTANSAGYLAGALAAAPIAKRFGLKRTFVAGLFSTAIIIGLSGATSNFGVLIALRIAAGVLGAMAFIAGGALAAAAGAGGGRARAPLVLGLYYAGGGMGIAASALVVPMLLAQIGWRGGWAVLGIVALLAACLAMPAVARTPAPAALPDLAARDARFAPRAMAWAMVGYALFGLGYIAYGTFIVAFLRKTQGFSPLEVSLFWALLGTAGIIAAFAWGPILARLRGGLGTAATLGVLTLGAVLPLVLADRPAAYLSAVLFGGSFLAVVAAVSTFARKIYAPDHWTAAIGALTVAFGIGQTIGPTLSGFVSDGPSGIRSGLWLSAGILVLATLAAALQKEPREQST